MIFNSLGLALAYCKAHPGRYIFPIAAGRKFPPCVKDNLDSNASNDPRRLRTWVQMFGQVNWGVACKKSKLLVVDVDVKPGKVGRQTFDALDLEFGFPDTETVMTPSTGFHLYFEGEHVFSIGKHGFGPNIDTPNYVLIAGCVFKDGTSYTDVSLDPIAQAPSWFYDVIRSNKVRVENASDTVIDELDKPSSIVWAVDYIKNDAEPAIEGQGGELQTFKVAAALREMGVSYGRAVELMNEHYNVLGLCEPLWEYEALATKIRNAYNHASMSAAGGRTAEADFADDADFDPASIPAHIMGNKRKPLNKRTDKKRRDALARARALNALGRK
jgi:hypothetical protein